VLGFHTTIVWGSLKYENARLAEVTSERPGERAAPKFAKLSSPAGSRRKSLVMTNFVSVADSRS
jgi:hypothetical protein